MSMVTKCLRRASRRGYALSKKSGPASSPRVRVYLGPPVTTDEALMTAYVAGDEAAFDELFRRYAPLLERAMRRRLPSDSDAQDVVQQTFLQLHRARFDFDASRRFRPWLFTIAFNLQRELSRSRARKPTTSLEPDAASCDPAVRGDVEDVHRALATLPDQTREVIALHWLEGLSFADVAALVGASEGAVKIRAHRGYEALREFFERDA
jgi:RNA polymerase sigma factor (sigma-70 family)